MAAGGKNYWSRWYMMHSSGHVPDTQLHNSTKFFTIFTQMMPYANITLKMSSMEHLQFYNYACLLL